MDLTSSAAASSKAAVPGAARLQAQGAVPVPFDTRPRLARLGLFDWLFALALVAGDGFALVHYQAHMNYYDKLVLICVTPAFMVLGWRWKPVQIGRAHV